MISVLLIQPAEGDIPPLAADFHAAGFQVHGPVPCAHLVRVALREGPNVVVCWEPRAGADLLDAVRTLQAQQPFPMIVFTQDTSAEWMTQALEAGVHAWVVQGYARERLRPLVQLAQAREARDRKMREELADLHHRFEERKLVDRAKGFLMHGRRTSEEEAFQLLRTAAMHGHQRVGEIARHVIAAGQVAEAVNRAGQQRMLSQRLVKLYALACARSDAAASAALMRQSAARVDENLAALGKLSAATFGDLLEAARDGWMQLRPLVNGPPQPEQLPRVDAFAEAMLAQADTLVAALETSGLAPTVGVVNIAGRQRMLAQRMAKQALLGADCAETAAAFEAGMKALAASPLSTQETRQALERARGAWERLAAARAAAREPAGRTELAAASEELLALFDGLTEAYQHSIQLLMGSSDRP